MTNRAEDDLPGGPAEAVATALENVGELRELLRPILAGLAGHPEGGRQLGILFNAYLGAIEAELKGLLKFAAGVEFEEEEEADDEPLWDFPAEGVTHSLSNLGELSGSLGPILGELQTREGPERELGERIAVLLRDIEAALRAVIRHERGQADA
jgi:hypothetical protein